jgi:ABC-2 type transport system ATP-binding protein
VGLDTKSRHAIVKYVHDLAAGGLTVLWATHLVDEIDGKDDVVILHKGRVLAHDRASEIAGDRALTDVFMEMTAEPEETAT